MITVFIKCAVHSRGRMEINDTRIIFWICFLKKLTLKTKYFLNFQLCNEVGDNQDALQIIKLDNG